MSLVPFRADHYVGGVTFAADSLTRLSVELYSKRFDGVLRPASFDYPVVVNATGTIRLTAAWSVSAKASYFGGRPLTPLDFIASSAQRRAVYDLERVNADRAPDYFRLDVRVDRSFQVGDRRVSVFAGVQNATNRRNVAGYRWDRRENVLRTSEQLGVFPIVGLEWPF